MPYMGLSPREAHNSGTRAPYQSFRDQSVSPIPLSNHYLREDYYGTKRALYRRMALKTWKLLSCQLLLAILAFGGRSGVAQAAASGQWIPPEDSPKVGEPTEIVCRTQWAIGESALNVLPVETPSLDWGRLQLLRTESALDGGHVHVDHVFSLTVAAAGTFKLPALEIPYLDGDLDASEERPTIHAPSVEIEIRPFNRALYTAATAAAVTAMLATIAIALRLRNTQSQIRTDSIPNRSNLDDARAALNRAHTLRIDGDFYGCYQALARSVSATGAANELLAADLTQRAQATGYGATRPDDAMLESDFRAVDRAITQMETSEESDFDTTANQNEVAKS